MYWMFLDFSFFNDFLLHHYFLILKEFLLDFNFLHTFCSVQYVRQYPDQVRPEVLPAEHDGRVPVSVPDGPVHPAVPCEELHTPRTSLPVTLHGQLRHTPPTGTDGSRQSRKDGKIMEISIPGVEGGVKTCVI